MIFEVIATLVLVALASFYVWAVMSIRRYRHQSIKVRGHNNITSGGDIRKGGIDDL